MRDPQHFGVGLVGGRGWMNFKLAKGPRKRDMLFAVKRLTAKKDNFILQQRRMHLLEKLGIGARQICADQFRPQRRCQWPRFKPRKILEFCLCRHVPLLDRVVCTQILL